MYSPLIEGDNLAVDDRPVGHGRQGFHDSGITAIEILVIARPQPHLPIVLYRQGAVAIEFQLNQPAGTLGQPLRAEQKHGLDERGFGLFLWHWTLKDSARGAGLNDA